MAQSVLLPEPGGPQKTRTTGVGSGSGSGSTSSLTRLDAGCVSSSSSSRRDSAPRFVPPLRPPPRLRRRRRRGPTARTRRDPSNRSRLGFRGEQPEAVAILQRRLVVLPQQPPPVAVAPGEPRRGIRADAADPQPGAVVHHARLHLHPRHPRGIQVQPATARAAHRDDRAGVVRGFAPDRGPRERVARGVTVDVHARPIDVRHERHGPRRRGALCGERSSPLLSQIGRTVRWVGRHPRSKKTPRSVSEPRSTIIASTSTRRRSTTWAAASPASPTTATIARRRNNVRRRDVPSPPDPSSSTTSPRTTAAGSTP